MKLSDKWVSGLPDVLMVVNGKAYFYEVKAEKGKLSEIQKITHQIIRGAGAFVQVVNQECFK